MKSRIRRKILFILFWIILIVTFCFSAFLIVLKAQGYQLNYKHWKIIKTGMIILNGEPNDSDVFLGGEDLKRGLPLRLANLVPGTYTIVISKENYQNWERKILVEAGKAANFSDILLFSKTAQDYQTNEVFTLDKLTGEARAYQTDLQVSGSEIIYQGKLVTRFSQDITAAFLYPDNKHIVFQLGKEIRVIELDGSNNTLLFKQENPDSTVITFRNSDKTIIYLDGENIRAKTIR